MIHLDKVTKYFGSFPAITDISFQVERGEVLGFLGPNGAGKSTVMKIITGFLPPTSGSVTVVGYDVVHESLEARRHIGYLPETVPLYPEMTVQEYLTFMGRIRGMSRAYIRRRIDDVVELCRLEDYRSTHIGKLSKGFRQRVGVSQAILHEPDVLILDEPTIGIDPAQVVETRQLIKSLGREHTVMISTHILPEASAICGRVIIIHEGQIVAMDSTENLRSYLPDVEHIEMDVRGPDRAVIQVLRRVEGVTDVVTVPADGGDFTSYRLKVRRGAEQRAQIASAVVRGGWDLLRLGPVDTVLEEVFLRLTTGEEARET